VRLRTVSPTTAVHPHKSRHGVDRGTKDSGVSFVEAASRQRVGRSSQISGTIAFHDELGRKASLPKW
jgi:hypothetical protein